MNAWIVIALVASAGADDFAQAKKAYKDARYAEAIAGFEEVFAQPSLSDDNRREALLLQAYSHVAMSHSDAARRCFRALLFLQPAFSLPAYAPPKVRDAFEKARLGKPTLHLALPLQKTIRDEREVVEIRVTALNADDTQAALYWRVRGATEYALVALGGQTEMVAEIGVPRLGNSSSSVVLEYFAILRSGRNDVAAAGSAKQPLQFLVRRSLANATPEQVALSAPPQVSTPVVKQWWFWTAIAAVAAGGIATGVYFATRPTPKTASLEFRLEGLR
jgi:hypothetical protein